MNNNYAINYKNNNNNYATWLRISIRLSPSPHGACTKRHRNSLAPQNFLSAAEPNSHNSLTPSQTLTQSPNPEESKTMDRRSNRRVQIDESQEPKYDVAEDGAEGNGLRLRLSDINVTEDQEPFMGVKVRRRASLHRDYKGDYIDVASHPYLMKILQKQGQLCSFLFLIDSFRFFNGFFFFFTLNSCGGHEIECEIWRGSILVCIVSFWLNQSLELLFFTQKIGKYAFGNVGVWCYVDIFYVGWVHCVIVCLILIPFLWQLKESTFCYRVC